MSLPFTRDEFIAVFRSYNDAIGIAPLLLLALAVAVMALAYSRRPWRHRVIAGLLAMLWLWSGVVYHWGFFADINPAARLFGVIFVAQAALLVLFGVVRGQWTFDPQTQSTAAVGWLLIAYALVVYPTLGWLLGHGYPNGPSFGAPCPTTIFFLGTMLWVARGVPIVAVVIPVAWALVGSSAAITLGIQEDLALGLSAVVIVTAIVRQRVAARRPAPALKGS